MVKTDIQIRFADVDILGHVNNVNLQHFFDVGKSDFFRRIMHIGLVWKGLGLITASTQTSYFDQTRLDDRVYVETEAEKVGNKSITLLQRLVDAPTGRVNAESRTVLVAFDFARQESVPVPDRWREAIAAGMAGRQQ